MADDQDPRAAPAGSAWRPASGEPVAWRIAGLLLPAAALSAAFGALALLAVPSDLLPGWAGSEARGALAALAVVLGVAFLLWKVPQWQAASWARKASLSPRDRFDIENASRATLGQLLSGIGLLAGLFFAWQQLGSTSRALQINQDGQLTDRFTSAVAQLSSPDLSQRLGGIYALERIAADSPRDFRPAIEVLAAFVREHPGPPDGPPREDERGDPDVLAVLSVLSRRTPEQMAQQREAGLGCIDLAGGRFERATLFSGNLQMLCLPYSDLRLAALFEADFTDSELSFANLSGAFLANSTFGNANLGSVDLSGADLSQARFDEAVLIGADLSGSRLDGAVFQTAMVGQAVFTDASLEGADLSGILDLAPDQLTEAQLAQVRALPEGFADPSP